MTNTDPSNGANRRRAKRRDPPATKAASACNGTSAPPPHIGLALVTPIVGQEFLDRYRLRDPLNRALRYGIKQAFSVAGASTRQFKRVQGLRGGPARLKSSGKDYFDLTPDDEQKMIVDTVSEFAEEVLRPAARGRPTTRRRTRRS